MFHVAPRLLECCSMQLLKPLLSVSVELEFLALLLPAPLTTGPLTTGWGFKHTRRVCLFNYS